MNQYLPLYARIRADLVKRLSAGEWQPGTALPSEMALAAQLDVSQGTVRKAIDSLVADGALIRAQGKGTFVAEQTAELANFRFLRISDANNQRVIPELIQWNAAIAPANTDAAKALSIQTGAKLHMIIRSRAILGKPTLLETIRIPDAIMPGLSTSSDLPNALYPYYQKGFGVTVLRTDDRLSAVSADAAAASALQVPTGTPLLRSERIAYDLTDRAVEYRISHFITDEHAFSVRLG